MVCLFGAFFMFYRRSKTKAFVYGVTFGFSQCVVFFAYAATFRFGAWLVSEGRMEFENVFKYVPYHKIIPLFYDNMA